MTSWTKQYLQDRLTVSIRPTRLCPDKSSQDVIFLSIGKINSARSSWYTGVTYGEKSQDTVLSNYRPIFQHAERHENAKKPATQTAAIASHHWVNSSEIPSYSLINNRAQPSIKLFTALCPSLGLEKLVTMPVTSRSMGMWDITSWNQGETATLRLNALVWLRTLHTTDAYTNNIWQHLKTELSLVFLNYCHTTFCPRWHSKYSLGSWQAYLSIKLSVIWRSSCYITMQT